MFDLQDDDVVYEYELQKVPGSVSVWKRYIDSWELQFSQGKKELKDVMWLYERMVQCVSEFEMWERYIRLVETHDVAYMQVFSLYRRCLEQCEVNGEFLSKFVKFCVQSYDLGCIRQCVGLLLTKFKGKVREHETVWNMILTFINENMIPIDEVGNEGIEFEDYDDLRMEIYKLLFTENLNDENDDDDNDDDDDERDQWSSTLLYKFLMVCTKDMTRDILRLIVKTRDYRVIKKSFDDYLFRNDIHKTLSEQDTTNITSFDFDLFLEYLNTLDTLKMDDKYKEFWDLLMEEFPQHKTLLVIKLADFFMKRSQFDRMEEVLVENIDKTTHMKDFISIYNHHVNFEQAYVETILDELRDDEEIRKNEKWGKEIEKHLVTLSNLTGNYHLKINDLRIRQNPNFIKAWVDRADLFDAVEDKCKVFVDAIEAVDPLKVREPGTFGTLWVLYASLYWDKKKYDEARTIFQSAIKVPYPYLNDLEVVWEDWVNKELTLSGFQRAVDLLTKALQIPLDFESVIEKYKSTSKKPPAQTILFCSKKLWEFYIDILESSDSPNIYEQIIDAYENILKLKLITPVGVVNYANFFKSHNKLNESLQIYEKGLTLFPPQVRYEIWTILIQEVMNPIYKLTTEHIRHTFEQSLDDLQENNVNCSSIYISYSKFEEERTHQYELAIQILLKGAKIKLTGKKMNFKSNIHLWNLAIEKCKQHLKDNELLRKIYAECIEFLPNSAAIDYVISFINLEISLEDYTRARELLQYGAQLLPPVKNESLWKIWEDFELQYGDKENYKETLMLKQKLTKEMKVDTEEVSKEQGNVQFVASTTKKTTNPDEIDIDI